jgi:chromosome segregation ATPase
MATPQINRAMQELEQLKKKYTELDRDKAKTEANLKNAADQLEALKAQARQQFGTDDLAELRKKLDEMRLANQQKLAAYQKHLETIETGLAEVEREYNQGK